jgi:hypothetical protein
VPFVLAWLLCLLIYLQRVEQRPSWMLFLSTTFLGLGLYSYIASLIMMPVYLLMTWLTLYLSSIRALRVYLVALAGLIWPLIFMALWLTHHSSTVSETLVRYRLDTGTPVTEVVRGLPMPQLLEEVRRMVRFSEITGRISLYWYFFDPAYLFVTGSYAHVVTSTRHVGVFAVPLFVFVPLGLVDIVLHRRTPANLIVLLGFLSAPLAACVVVPEPYAIDRELALLPFGALAATFGVERMLRASAGPSRIAAIVLLVLVPLHFAFFLFDYFGDYRRWSAFWFEGNRRGALEAVIALDSRVHPPAIYMNTDRIPYIESYWQWYALQHGRQDLIGRTVYFALDDFDLRLIAERSLVLARPEDVPRLEAFGHLRRLATIPEPADAPTFVILQR